jgi:hypothetical protein
MSGDVEPVQPLSLKIVHLDMAAMPHSTGLGYLDFSRRTGGPHSR